MTREEFAPLLSRFLGKYDRFLISGHIRPDGDSVASCAALSYVISAMGKEPIVIFDGDASRYTKVLEPFSVLPDDLSGREALRAFKTGSDFAFLMVDCGELARTGKAESAVLSSQSSLCVDHHMCSSQGCNFNYCEPESSSCSEILYHLLRLAGIPIGFATAQALFMGMCFDTGGLRHSSTSAETFEMARELKEQGVDTTFFMNYLFHTKSMRQMKAFAEAVEHAKLYGSETARQGGRGVLIACMSQEDFEKAGLSVQDAEGVAGDLNDLEESDVICYLREIEPGLVRVNMRTKHIVDANRVCNAFGGGGHVRAAGCTLYGTVEEAAAKLLRVIRNQLPEEG